MYGQNSGEFWVAAAALIAIQMAQGRSTDEIDLLGSFLTSVADNLFLIAAQQPESTEPPQG